MDAPITWDMTEKPAILTVSVAKYPSPVIHPSSPYCMAKGVDVFWKDEEVDELYVAMPMQQGVSITNRSLWDMLV